MKLIEKITLNYGTFSIGFNSQNFRRDFDPSRTCLANNAVISRDGGVYLKIN